MNKLSKLGLVLASSLFSFSSNAVEGATAYIVNGSDATIAAYPSYARLVRADWAYSNTYSRYCGAVILNSNYILTAGHCAYIESNSDEVRMLLTYVYPQLENESQSNLLNATQVRISDVYLHGSYDNDSLLNDIAILKLESSISISSSDDANLPSNENYRLTSDTYIAVGHGDNSTDSDTTTQLQQVELDYVANASCGYGSVPDTNLCMKGVDTTTSSINNETVASLDPSTCQGDSGGPLYWDNAGTQTLVGITSFGPATNCGDTSYNSTSVFSEVNDYKSWINNVIGGTPSNYTLYSFSESDRSAYRNDTYSYKYSTDTTTTTATSSGGGGAIPFWSILLLASGIFLRRKQK